MKPEFLTKLVDLLTNPKSKHRVLPHEGEFRLAGSTYHTGTFELVLKYEGDVMTLSGHCGRQYLTVTIEEDMFNFKVLRRQGAFIKNDTKIHRTDAQAIFDWMDKWMNVEVAAEQ